MLGSECEGCPLVGGGVVNVSHGLDLGARHPRCDAGLAHPIGGRVYPARRPSSTPPRLIMCTPWACATGHGQGARSRLLVPRGLLGGNEVVRRNAVCEEARSCVTHGPEYQIFVHAVLLGPALILRAKPYARLWAEVWWIAAIRPAFRWWFPSNVFVMLSQVRGLVKQVDYPRSRQPWARPSRSCHGS